MARDFSLDSMPKGYVWDLVDYIPSQRGAQLEGRGPWTFLTQNPLAGQIWSGYDAVYKAGEKLLVHGGQNLYDQPRMPQGGGAIAANLVGSLFGSTLHNGRFFFDKVYWADSQGLQNPKYVTYDGSTVAIAQLAGANTPKAKLLCVWKNRLLAAGDPAQPEYVRWAPPFGSKTPNGPLSDWATGASLGFGRSITALGPMANVCVVFHDGMTSRIKGGTIPPDGVLTQRDGMDTTSDTFSDQYGCVDPASVVPWQENLIWACSHGVMLTDGSTIRSLSDQGGIGQVWRYLYALKRPGTQVSCGIYLNKLFVSILTQWDNSTIRENRPFTFVCDLATRAWFRLSNAVGTCLIPSTTGAEQLWFGTDSVNQNPAFANRLARISPVFSGITDIDPDPSPPGSLPALPVNQDDDQRPILPRITTAWVPIGAAGQKRMRAVYVAHATQMPTTTPATDPATPVLRVGYRLTPVILDSFVEMGQLPAAQNGLPYSNMYDRKRLPLGRAGYGIQVHIEQVAPSHISRLYDIQVENWQVDRARVT
jgi:hypothetical protein